MVTKSIAIWFDPEGDFLEVLFDRSKAGYFRETSDDRVMEKVDERGNVIGFSILGISSMKSAAPIKLALN